MGDGISVSTIQGFRPGDDLRAFADELGEEWHEEGLQSFPAETGPEIGERGYDEWNDTYWEYANAYAVDVSAGLRPATGCHEYRVSTLELRHRPRLGRRAAATEVVRPQARR